MEKITLSGGVHIHYRVAGTGPALLLQHGWGGSSLYWQSTVANLSDLRTVYAIDLPGYGQSPPMTLEAAHPERLAMLLMEFVDAVGIEQIDLIGHSFGANLVSYVAANYPTRVNHLVLTCPATYRNDRERQMVRFVHRLMGLTLRMRRPWVGRIPPVYRRISRRFFYRLPDDNVLLREGFKDFLRMDRQTATQSALNAVDDSINKVFRSIEVPTLILGASNDQIMPRHGPSTVAQLIPGSRLVWIEQCGHLPMVERPEAYHWIVRDFLTNGAASEEMPSLSERMTRISDSMMTRDGRPVMGNRWPAGEGERPAAAAAASNRGPAMGDGRPASANRGAATSRTPTTANLRPMAANRGGFMDKRGTDATATQRDEKGSVGRPAVAPTQGAGRAKQKVAVDVGNTDMQDVYAASNGEQQEDTHTAPKGVDTHRTEVYTTAKHGDTEKQATPTPTDKERQEVYTPPKKERQQQNDVYGAPKRDRQDTYAPPASKSASPRSTTARPAQHGSGGRERQQDAYASSASSSRPAAASMVHTGGRGQQAMVSSRGAVDVSWAEAQKAAQQAAEVAAYQTEVAAQQAAAALNQQAAADAARQAAEVAQAAAAAAQRVAALAALQATEEAAMQVAALAEQQALAARQASAAAEAHQTALEIAQRMAVEFEHL